MTQAEQTLFAAIDKVAAQRGSLRAAAKFLGIEPAYLWRVRKGKKTPSANLLKKFGYKRVIVLVKEAGDD